MFKLLVTGGRDFKDEGLLNTVLFKISKKHPDLEIWTGSARGADTLAELWAKSHELRYRGFPAMWKMLGPPAGPIRNGWMIEEGPDAVVAFPGGNGTADCVDKAKAKGIPVWEVGNVGEREAERMEEADEVGSS